MPDAPRRERLDVLLVRRGLASTRTKARALVLAGKVRSGTRRLDKAGTLLPVDTTLEIDEPRRFVGRGGFKLAGALERFSVAVEGADALDVGASTGGFTQVLLEAGAARVIALDVGRGLIDWALRNDPRVVVIEGVNARHLEPESLPFRPRLATIDVSFISLRKVLPAVVRCLAEPGEIVALVKPQFEVGPEQVGKGGIVLDPGARRAALASVARAADEAGCGILATAPSPIRGAEGNAEYFLHLRRGTQGLEGADLDAAIDAAIEETPGGKP